MPKFRAEIEGGIEGLRIGVLHQALEDIDPEVRAAVQTAIGELESLGAELHEIHIPHLDQLHIANSIIYLVEGFVSQRDPLLHHAEDIGQVFRIYGFLGGVLSGAQYVQAQRLRSRTKREVRAVFDQVDLMTLPVTDAPPAKIAEFDPFSLTGSRRSSPSEIFNLASCPAISVPCGFSEAGLPIGLQLAAPPFDESTLLRAAYTYQQHRGLHQRHPGV